MCERGKNSFILNTVQFGNSAKEYKWIENFISKYLVNNLIESEKVKTLLDIAKCFEFYH